MQREHDTDVAQIADQVREFYAAKKPFKIFHGNTNSTRIQRFKRDETVDVSKLNHVLSVDVTKQLARVEPNVPMDKLVAATRKYSLVPKVVMEFPGITVGGGVQGGAGESSSFRYGCFNQICAEYEMILANGTVTTASARKNSDLFYGTAGSFGTLGVITSATVELVPAKKYVQLTYLPVRGFTDAVATLSRVAAEDYDYVDGIMFSKSNGVIIAGKLSDQKAGRVERFTRAHDQWYYLHAEQISMRAEQHTETVPLWDYLFRYDRGAFWVGRFAYEMFGVSYTRFTRWLLNPFMHTRKLYEALQESGASQQHVVQDLALPEGNAVKFMEHIEKTYGIYPLWLCPLKTDHRSPFQSNNLDTPKIINVGVWGNRVASYDDFLAANRDIEKTVARLGGKKWFYAHSYYPEKEFWQVYDKAGYDKLRRKYHATHLPTVYDKVTVRERFPIDLKKGAYRTMWGRAKLRITP